MDKDLISRSALILEFCDSPEYSASMSKKIKRRIEAAPVVDAVEVVRCKDCKHRIKRKEFVYICKANGGFIRWGSNGFCCRGERSDNG